MQLPLPFRPSTRRDGFTLIEIMMAFAIFSLLIASIYACWTLILKSTKIGQDAAAQTQRQRIAMRTIKEALEGVLSFQADQQNYSFLADNDNNGFLSFASRLPDTFPRNSRPSWRGFDVRRVSFTIETGPEYSDRQLVLRQTPLLKEIHPDEQEFPFVVAKNVNKMELEFWDLRKSDWVTEWTRTNELPKMIKIRLEFSRRIPNQPYAQPITEELVDVAPLPAIMVPAAAQAPNQPPPGGGIAPPPVNR